MMENFDGNNIVMLLFGALPCITLGYLIAIKQKRQLIAGWDASQISNPAAFARLVGGSTLFLGLALALISIAEGIQIISDVQTAILLLIGVTVPPACLIIAIKKYRKKS